MGLNRYLRVLHQQAGVLVSLNKIHMDIHFMLYVLYYTTTNKELENTE